MNTFAQNLTTLAANLNALHPFRDGNGRVQRIFLNELAHNAGFALNFNLIPKNDIIKASIQAMQGDNIELFKLIKTNLYNNTQIKLQKKLEINLNNYEKVSDELQNILIPKIDFKTQEKIATLIQESFALRAKAKALLEEAKIKVETKIKDASLK